MHPVSMMIKPSSGNCNMHCDYCFYADEMDNRSVSDFGFMTEETLENVIKKAFETAQGFCTIAFQGGEPTLRGLDFFKKAVELEYKYNKNNIEVRHALQTNGLLLNREWASFFRENNFLIGISLDGKKAGHDALRHTKSGEDTFEAVLNAIKILREENVDFNILTVVNKLTVKQARKIYSFYQKNDLDFLQFIPCLPPIREDMENYSPSAYEYGSFLNELFDCWFEDLKQGRQPYIRQFENYVAILLGRAPDCCDQSGVCQSQYVIEADGSVYPCDFYVLDGYRLGNLNEDSLEVIDDNRIASDFLKTSAEARRECAKCEYYGICRGGCYRHFVTTDEGKQINRFCESYKAFFDAHLKDLQMIARNIKLYGRG
ncbi:MAG: anaerobic sulfatase maturase [Lachnospiraceae bacterium]|nr:anaerobic sulfatase maturase [Lachnospiraceae bacterium]